MGRFLYIQHFLERESWFNALHSHLHGDLHLDAPPHLLVPLAPQKRRLSSL